MAIVVVAWIDFLAVVECQLVGFSLILIANFDLGVLWRPDAAITLIRSTPEKSVGETASIFMCSDEEFSPIGMGGISVVAKSLLFIMLLRRAKRDCAHF